MDFREELERAARRASERLDRVDRLDPRSASVDLFGFTRGGLNGGLTGVGLEAEYRATDWLSAFVSGSTGYGWGEQRGLTYEALGGLRMRF